MSKSGQGKLIVGNWKMNFTQGETMIFLKQLLAGLKKLNLKKTTVAIAPPFTSLAGAAWTLKGSEIKIAAQNMYFEEHGAYTGEISAGMVKEFADLVIIGHSERRHIFGERDTDVRKKVAKAVAHKLVPIIGVGETRLERQDGHANAVVSAQLEAGLADLTAAEVQSVVVAYEPVWAIGTGEACAPDQADQMNGHIRRVIAGIYGPKIANKIRVLYGGSVNGKNVGSYLRLKSTDGALVGGASVKFTEFMTILEVAEKTGAKK